MGSIVRCLLGSIAVAALGVVLAGCGGGSHRPPAAGRTAALGDVEVIRAWAQALARGDVAGAGAYFATPSRVQIAPDQPVATVASAADARTLNAMLPCGARLLDARPVARYIDALFLLSTRPGAACDGIGGTARVAFVIHGGKIVVWRRIADEPGDAARAAPGHQPPAAPSPPTGLPPAARSI